MNTILNSYKNISDKELFSRIAFYESNAFLEETILLMIPDVVQYVRNIFESLRYAEQSRLIVADITSQITDYRKKRHQFVNSTGYQLGTLHVDSRAYAQRNIREWCEHIAKSNDSIYQILNIVLNLGLRQWDFLSSFKIKKGLTAFGNQKLIALCSSFYQQIQLPQRLNDFSKHNLNLWGIEKFRPTALNEVEYYIRFDGNEYAVSNLMSVNREREIACSIIELLDYLFTQVDTSRYMNRYYVRSDFDICLPGSAGYTSELKLPDNYFCPITFTTSRNCDGAYMISSAKLHIDGIPQKELLLATAHAYDTGAMTLSGIALFGCDSFDVYCNGSCIGRYDCLDHVDRTALYFHFKKYTFTKF